MPEYYPAKRAVKAALFLLVACAAAYGQQPRLMLGQPDQTPDKYSPKYNIRYNDADFADPRPGAVKKSCKYIANHGGSQYVLDTFRNQANTITTSDPDWFGKMIDQAWERRTAAFSACGGNWAQAAANTSPSNLYVAVQPTLWQVSIYGSTYWVHGEMNPLGGGQYAIKAINIYVNSIMSDPANAYVVEFSATVEWELGNALADAAGYRWNSVETEIGNKSPCGAQ